jgi:uncharacterized protein (TIGR02246 family)
MVSAPSSASKEEEAIKQVFADLSRCLSDSDAQCVGNLFVEDGTYAWPTGGAKISKGKAQIVETLQALMGTSHPGTEGPQPVLSVENVRMICDDDRAVVDSTVEFAGGKAPEGSYRAIAVMARNRDKWLFEDLRSYVIDTAPAKASLPPAKESEPPAKKSAPSAKQ